MDQSILEQEIEKWAIKKEYIISPRKFYAQLQAENEIARAIGLEEKDKVLFIEIFGERTVREREGEFVYQDLSDLSRLVYFPSGILVYNSSFREFIRGEPNEESYREHLERVGGFPLEDITFVYANDIANWRSEKIPFEDRLNGGNCPELNLKGPIFQIDFSGEIGQDRLGVLDGNRLKKEDRDLFRPIKHGDLLERNPANYQKILDAFDRLIKHYGQ